MAKMKIQDVVVPEVFAPYVSNRTKELSAVVKSGIAATCPLLDELVSGGGKLINMPFWNDLSGDDEILSDSAPLTPQKITAGKDVAALLIRGKAWSSNELAGALAGADPMMEIAGKVASWTARQERKTLFSVLTGVFGAESMSGHVNDQSAKSITGDMILDTKQLLGDAADKLAAIVMHSRVYTSLQKQNLISAVPNSDGLVQISTYMGYRVIIDDNCPFRTESTKNIYCTYLFKDGAIGRGEGVPPSLTPIETARDSLQSEDILICRRAFVLHPFGVRWTNNTIAGATPTDAELANPLNWERVYEDKMVGMAMLMHLA